MIAVVRLLPIAIAALLSPLLLGLIVRVKAYVGGRNGAPVLQPYRDIWKLVGKGEVRSTSSTAIFRLGPILSLASTLLALLLVPLGNLPAAVSFPCDIVFLAYLLALGRFGTVCAAMDTGSAFEGMGASREAVFSALAEPALFMVLFGFAWSNRELSLAGCLSGSGVSQGYGLPAFALLASALFLILLSENCRIPVDDPATHLELTMIHEVMVLDHSGPTFAIIQYGAGLKMWLFGLLLVSPWVPSSSGLLEAEGLAIGGMAIVAVSVGLVESLTARLRLDSVPRLLALASVLAALGDLVLLTGGKP